MRVGVMLPQMDASFQELLAFAQRAEALGLDGAFLVDHLWPLSGREKPMPECWTALAAATAATSRLLLGTLVTRVTVRPPSLLAKMAATVDEIGNGRLVLGIGSGDDLNRGENEAYGLAFFDRTQRVGSLREYLRVLDLMWRQDRPTFHGTYFHVQEPTLLPKPVQQPRPPLWVGGRAPITRQVAAELADGWNAWNLSVEEFAASVQDLHARAAALGRDPLTLTASWAGHVAVREQEAAAAGSAAQLQRDDPLVRRVVTGTPAECAAQLAAYRAAGAAWIIADLSGPNPTAALELFGSTVAPLLFDRGQ